VTAALQWKPTDNLLLTLDVLHGRVHHPPRRDAPGHAAAQSDGSVAFDAPAGGVWPAAFQKGSIINGLDWDSDNYVTKTDVTGTTFGSEHRRSLNKNRFNQLALTGKWDASRSPLDRRACRLREVDLQNPL
jgi:iron complex outermembrane receptor protein